MAGPKKMNTFEQAVNAVRTHASQPGVTQKRLEYEVGALQSRMEEIGNSVNGQPIEDTLSQISAIGAALDPRKRKLEEEMMASGVRGQKAVTDYVSRYSSTNESHRRINGYSRSSEGTMSGYAIAGRMSYGQVEESMQSAQARVLEGRERLRGLAQSGASNAELMSAQTLLSREERNVSRLQSGLNTLTRKGLDPGSLLESSYGGSLRAQDVLNRDDMRKTISDANRPFKMDDLNKAIREAAEGVKKASEELKKAVESGAENVNEFASKLEQAKDKLDSSEGFKREAVSQGRVSQGGSFFDNLIKTVTGSPGKAISAAGDAVLAASDVARYLGVTDVMKRTQNQVGYAGIMNEQFDAANQALRGRNIRSLRNLGMFSALRENAAEVRAVERVASAGDTVGTGLRGVGDTMQTVTDANPVGAISVGVYSAAATVKSANNSLTGRSAQEIEIQNFQLGKQQADAMNHIYDQVSQEYVDSMYGIGMASRGAGGRRGMLDKQFMNSKSVTDLAGLGIGADQIPGLIQSGIGNLGGSFRGMQSVARAGQLQQSGYLSTDQYMSMSGQLAGAGAKGEAGLEKILREAVAAGMDSSKQIQQLVDVNLQAASAYAASGGPGAGGASSMISAAVQALKGSDIDVNQRAGVAANAAAKVNQMSSDSGFNLYTVMEQGDLRKKFGGLKGTDPLFFSNLAKLDMSQTREMADIYNSLSPEERQKDARLAALRTYSGDIANPNELLDSKVGKTVNQTVTSIGDAKTKGILENIIKNKKEYSDLNKEEIGVLSVVSANAGQRPEAFLSTLVGGKPAQQNPNAGPSNAGERLAITGAQTTAKNIETGEKQVGSLDNFAKTLEATLKNYDPVKMANDVKKVVDSMDLSAAAGQFKTAAETFERAVKDFKGETNTDNIQKAVHDLKTKIKQNENKAKGGH